MGSTLLHPPRDRLARLENLVGGHKGLQCAVFTGQRFPKGWRKHKKRFLFFLSSCEEENVLKISKEKFTWLG